MDGHIIDELVNGSYISEHRFTREVPMRYFCILLFLCAHTLLISRERPSHLKAFIVYDDEDSSLRQCYQKDRIRIKKCLQTIASLTKLTPKIQTVMASQLHPTKLFSWIHTLSPKDVAVFYYAGKPQYGFGEWPYLSFPHIKCIVTQTQLTTAMKKKKPHLSLILFDCYSSILSTRWTHARKNPSIKVFPKTGIARLFLKSSGVFSACSTTQGESGYALQRKGLKGGIFSLGILNYLQSFDPKTMMWCEFFYCVRSTCRGVSDEKQHPRLLVEDINNPASHYSHIKSPALNKH